MKNPLTDLNEILPMYWAQTTDFFRKYGNVDHDTAEDLAQESFINIFQDPELATTGYTPDMAMRHQVRVLGDFLQRPEITPYELITGIPAPKTVEQPDITKINSLVDLLPEFLQRPTRLLIDGLKIDEISSHLDTNEETIYDQLTCASSFLARSNQPEARY